jgi:hypothetical protein
MLLSAGHITDVDARSIVENRSLTPEVLDSENRRG